MSVAIEAAKQVWYRFKITQSAGRELAINYAYEMYLRSRGRQNEPRGSQFSRGVRTQLLSRGYIQWVDLDGSNGYYQTTDVGGSVALALATDEEVIEHVQPAMRKYVRHPDTLELELANHAIADLQKKLRQVEQQLAEVEAIAQSA
jgi:hypothetical protein